MATWLVIVLRIAVQMTASAMAAAGLDTFQENVLRLSVVWQGIVTGVELMTIWLVNVQMLPIKLSVIIATRWDT